MTELLLTHSSMNTNKPSFSLGLNMHQSNKFGSQDNKLADDQHFQEIGFLSIIILPDFKDEVEGLLASGMIWLVSE